MTKNKIGKLFNKTIVWGCSVNELEENELLYIKKGNNIVLKDNNGIKTTGDYNGYVLPTGTKEITDTLETDVSTYAKALISDVNLVAENIKNGVTILGVIGTYSLLQDAGDEGMTSRP